MDPTLSEVLPWPKIRLRLRSINMVVKMALPLSTYLSSGWGSCATMPQPDGPGADSPWQG